MFFMFRQLNQTKKIPTSLLKKYDFNGPRYTSYPTANNLKDLPSNQVLDSIFRSVENQNKHKIYDLYIHIPFCRSLCYYCGCNKIITRHSFVATEYLAYLSKEWDLYKEISSNRIKVNSIHLGGGTPTFLNDEQLSFLHNIYLKDLVSEDAEQSIEVDPRTVDEARLRHIKSLGFNRISFGIQDLDTKVQISINREQNYRQILDLIIISRMLDFKSINVDLIYGLPNQTLATFESTLNKIIDLRPDRIALYSYAHMPSLFKSQKLMDENSIPSAEVKISMFQDAIKLFTMSGYNYIGMDHFALPDDELSIAKKQGRLHRNFQGYTTNLYETIGLGISSISQYHSHYLQNTKYIPDYYKAIDDKRLPIQKGISLNMDDLIRRAIIVDIMSHGFIVKRVYEDAFQIDFDIYFRDELFRLIDFERDGLLRIADDEITITDLGWFFIRPIAMIFDQYLHVDRQKEQFSKVI